MIGGSLKYSICLVVAVCLCGCSSTPASGVENFPRWRKARAVDRKAEAISHYLTAVIYASQGKKDASLKSLARVPELDPGAMGPTIQLVRAYIRDENFEAALGMCEKAVKQRPNQANLHVVLGEIYHRVKRYDDAMKSFERAVALEPNNVMGYGALVELQESRNDLTAAIDIYERLIEITPDSPGLYYQLALVLIRVNNKPRAIEALQKTIELNPKLVRAQYLLGILYLESNQIEECIGQLHTYMKRRPNDMDAADNLAGAQARAGRFEQAIGIYQRILSSNQAQPQHHIAAMYLHLRAKRFDEVSKLSPPEGGAYFDMILQALAKHAAGKPTQLLVKALDAVEGDLDAECGRYLNNLLYLFGEHDTGTWLFEALGSLTEEADSRVLHLVRARILMAMDRHEEAIPLLESVLANFTPDQWVHYYLAICHEEAGHFQKTEEHLKAYMEFIPDDPDILNFLAYLYAEEGVKLDEAQELLRRALEADPENPYYMDSLGWTYYKLGRADEAVQYIQKALYGMDSDDAVLRDHLGDAFLLKGDVERAREEWGRAIRLDPDLEGIQEKLDRHQP